MKIKNILTGAAILAAFGGIMLTGCDESELYSANAPEWIADSVSTVAARKANNQGGGSSFDAEEVTSEGWWTAWSKNYDFPENQRMTIEVTLNKSARGNLWENWAMVLTTPNWTERNETSTGYAEYFVVRGDGGNWGGNGINVTTEDAMAIASEDYKAYMQDGTQYTIVAEHYPTGSILINCSQVNPAGDEWHWTATGNTKAGEACWIFFAGEQSTFTITNITYEKLEELKPTKLEVTGTPTAIQILDKDAEATLEQFYGNGIATVTWENGTTSTVAASELTFSIIPDLKTVGTSLVAVAYGKSSMGQFCEPVSTSYKIEVTAPISSIEIEPAATTYYYTAGTTEVKKEDIDVALFIKSVIGKTGSADLEIPASSYTTEITAPATLNDKIIIKVTYKEFSATMEVALKQMASDPVKIDLVKDADAFEFHGAAKMLNNEILMIESGAGGKNGNHVSLKESGWLKDKITFKDVVTISFDAYPTANASDWNYMFFIGKSMLRGNDAWGYMDGTCGFIQRMGDPYNAFFPGDGWVEGNAMGGVANGDNPYNYFMIEGNCNKWYHFDFIYSTTEVSIYVNGVKTMAHTLNADQSAAAATILASLNDGQLALGAGADPNLENFGGYMANFTLRNEEYHQTGDFYSAEIPATK